MVSSTRFRGCDGIKRATGWLAPLPDMRDYRVGHAALQPLLKGLGITAEGEGGPDSLPSRVDLRQWCSPVEDQGQLGSCTAQAVAGMVEYCERRAYGRHIDCSRRFIYKTTRTLMGTQGDSGAWLRSAMGALVLCGAPPEKHWPYTEKEPDFDLEPSGFAYAVADNFEALEYLCHDPAGSVSQKEAVLSSVKRFLAVGIPSAFGFFGFPSFEEGGRPGDIPLPCPNEQAEWGHAVVAVGYDDGVEIRNSRCGATATGALLIRNSWGAGWGEGGYGWLPYDYVRLGLALDFWSLLSIGWVESGQFG